MVDSVITEEEDKDKDERGMERMQAARGKLIRSKMTRGKKSIFLMSQELRLDPRKQKTTLIDV